MFILQVVEGGGVSMECIILKGVPRILVLFICKCVLFETSLNIMQSSLTPQKTTIIVP